MVERQNRMINMPNLLLIAGNGRNVGKTTLACRIIEQLSRNTKVTAIKISPHFHNFKDSEVIFKTDQCVIIAEKQDSPKDSSLMLKAGAEKVYFVMSHRENPGDAIEKISGYHKNEILVCESGGLREFIEPGLFLFVKRTGDEIVKKHLSGYSPIIVNNDGIDFDFDIKRIEILNNHFVLKQ